MAITFGELEGFLGRNAQGQLVLVDRLTGHQTILDQLMDDVEGFIGSRISVYGKIDYDHDSYLPTSVLVESWFLLKKDEELTSTEGIRAVMEPIPEGVSSEEYVRRLREDDDGSD